MLYELPTGWQPFAAPSFVDTIHNVVHRDPPMRAIPRRWRRIVSRCLAKEAGERYPSMKDVAHDLRDSLAQPRATRYFADTRLWLLVLVVAAVLFALLVLIAMTAGAAHMALWYGGSYATAGSAMTLRGGSAFISTQCASAAAPKPTNHA